MLMEMSRRILFYCFYIYYIFIWIQLIEFSKRKLNCLFVHFNRFIIRIEVKEQFLDEDLKVFDDVGYIFCCWWGIVCFSIIYFFYLCWWFGLMRILFKLFNKNWWERHWAKEYYTSYMFIGQLNFIKSQKKSIKVN